MTYHPRHQAAPILPDGSPDESATVTLGELLDAATDMMNRHEASWQAHHDGQDSNDYFDERNGANIDWQNGLGDLICLAFGIKTSYTVSDAIAWRRS